MLSTDHSPETKKVFEFLKLPAEIRNMIYRNVLVRKCSVRFFFQPPITLANKQIRSESLPVFYGNNKFVLSIDRDLRVQDLPMLLPNLWYAPRPVSTVSTIPNLIYVAKLDIWFSFSNGWFARSEDVDVLVRMRKRDLTSRNSMKNAIVSQHGLKREDRAILESVYDLLVNDCLHGPEFIGERRIAYGGMDSVISTVLHLAEICPKAAECVWMELE